MNPIRPCVCLCAMLAFPIAAAAQPIAVISTPSPGACVCVNSAVSVRGTSAHTPPQDYRGDVLEYATNPAGPWTLIGFNPGSTPVTNNLLYTWNANGLPAGQYFLRLTVNGVTSSAATISPLTIGGGIAPPVISGVSAGEPIAQRALICVSKSATCQALASPIVEIRPQSATEWTRLSTLDRATFVECELDVSALAEGTLEIRASVNDLCAFQAGTTTSIQVRRTPPSLAIANLADCAAIPPRLLGIVGTVAGQDLRAWTIEFRRSDSSGDWTQIATASLGVNNGLLGVWDTRFIPPCTYLLRLRAESNARLFPDGPRLTSELLRAVTVGCQSDFNRSGEVSVQDVFDFLAIWFNPCF